MCVNLVFMHIKKRRTLCCLLLHNNFVDIEFLSHFRKFRAMKEPTSIKKTKTQQNLSALLISQECESNQCAVVKKNKVQHRTRTTKTTKKHNHNMTLHETLKEDGKVQVDEKKDDVNEVGGNNNEEKRLSLPRATSGVSVGQESFKNDAHSSSMKAIQQ